MFSAAIALVLLADSKQADNGLRCGNSFLALGDVLPYHQEPYVVRIDKLLDRSGSLVGWIYVGSDETTYLQAGALMKPSDIAAVGAKLPTSSLERSGSIAPIDRPVWRDLRVVVCPKDELTHRPYKH